MTRSRPLFYFNLEARDYLTSIPRFTSTPNHIIRSFHVELVAHPLVRCFLTAIFFRVSRLRTHEKNPLLTLFFPISTSYVRCCINGSYINFDQSTIRSLLKNSICHFESFGKKHSLLWLVRIYLKFTEYTLAYALCRYTRLYFHWQIWSYPYSATANMGARVKYSRTFNEATKPTRTRNCWCAASVYVNTRGSVSVLVTFLLIWKFCVTDTSQACVMKNFVLLRFNYLLTSPFLNSFLCFYFFYFIIITLEFWTQLLTFICGFERELLRNFSSCYCVLNHIVAVTKLWGPVPTRVRKLLRWITAIVQPIVAP